MKKFIYILFALVVLSACVQQRKQPTREEMYLSHQVKFAGETLAIISSWYTGNAKNWKIVLAANPNLKPAKMKVGDIIDIPRELLVKTAPLTKDYVKKFSGVQKSSEKEEVKTSTTPATQTTTAPEVTSSPDQKSENNSTPMPAGEDTPAALPQVEVEPTKVPSQEEKEALREKTRYELLDEILKLEKDGQTEANAPAAN